MKIVIIAILLGIYQNEAISQCDTFNLDLTFTHPLCPDYADGSVTAIPYNGTEPYDIDITDSDGTIRNIDGGSETGNFLLEGWYYIVIEDAVGCTFSDSVLLVDPLEINVESYVLTDPTELDICDGSISLSDVSGDFVDIFVYWSPDPDEISGLGAFEMSDACAGSYDVTLISELGCSVSAEYEIGIGLNVLDNTLFFIEIRNTVDGIIVNTLLNKNELIFHAYSLDGKIILSKEILNGENFIHFDYSGFIIYTITDSSGKTFYYDKTLR